MAGERQTEPHQAEGVIYDCPHAEVCKTCPCSHEDDACFPGERLRAEVARLRAERDELIAEREIPSDAIHMLEAQRAEWRVRAEAAEARVAELDERVASLLLEEPSKTQGLYAAIDELQARGAELEAERDAAAKSRDEYREGWLLRGRQMNEDRENVQDRIDRAVTEQRDALEAALREAISWSYGEDVTPERRDEIEREFLASTRTQEASER